MTNLDKKETDTFSSEEEKLRYMQTKIHEAILECINEYITLKYKISLLNSINGMIFMHSKIITDNIKYPARYKSSESVINNITKETLNMLSQLPINCSKEELDIAIPKMVQQVSKDFYGAKLIIKNNNDLRDYCEESDDPYIQQLYKQYCCVQNYLNESENIRNTSISKPSDSKDYSLSKGTPKSKTIDISQSFIDKPIDKNDLTSLPPLNITDISTKEDYCTQLVSLLTLLTNVGIPSLENNKYIVAQSDVPYFELVKRVSSIHPKNNDDFIKNLTALARMCYFTDYEPFDIQLQKAKKQLEKVSQNPRELSSENKDIHIRNLKYLKNNLEQCLNSRLCMAILNAEVPGILNSLSNLPNIKIDIISKKNKAKDNGYCATHYTIKSNSIALSELQTQTGFYNNLDQNGNCAHNSSITGKSTGIREFFELNPENSQPFEKGDLDLYCNYLETVNFNCLSEYKVPKAYLPQLRITQHLVKYASSKIRVKDTMTYGKKQIPFYAYINKLLEFKGAKFYDIFPANRIEHNQALIVSQNSMYSLETLLKSRIGFSALANLIRIKYKEEATKRDDALLPDEPPKALSSTLAPEYDFLRINKKLKEDLDAYEPINVPFVPMGSKHINNENDENSIQTPSCDDER